MSNDKKTRTFEKEVVIDASPEEVWKAITEAEEITKWFSTEAKVTPGEGGQIYLAWNEDFTGASDIVIWDPPHHLQTIDRREEWQVSDSDAPGAEKHKTPVRLTLDYFIEGKDGKTILRLVHSGFGHGKEWDMEFDAIKRGWGTMLLNLNKYLSGFSGQAAGHYWNQHKLEISSGQTWPTLLNRLGLEGSSISEGIRLAHPGEGDDGVVDVYLGDMELGLAFAENQELIRFSTFDTPDGSLFWVDLIKYNVTEEEFESTKKTWNELLSDIFKK